MRFFIVPFLFASLTFPSFADEDNTTQIDWDFKNRPAKKALNGYTSEIAKLTKDKEAAIKKLEDELKKSEKKHRLNLIMSLEKSLKKTLKGVHK